MKKFEFYLQQLQELLTKASAEKDPGLWLYQNNFRTPLFMLEALGKLYSSLHNKKKFTKLRERFKLLEDMLGAIDYYDAFGREFKTSKTIPKTVKDYFTDQLNKRVIALNDQLNDKEWLEKNKRVRKIREDLAGADWMKEGKEIKAIAEFYYGSIDKILAFADEKQCHFTDVETDVHELRRKLRWLSIYPQALRGSIQLSKDFKPSKDSKGFKPSKGFKSLEKYLVKDIVNSSYNKMPDAADNKNFLLLEQNYFYALSWMIAELGKIKDEGLRVFALKEALQQTEQLNDIDAFARAYELLGPEQPRVPALLKSAETICKNYFKEKNLQRLVVGTS